MVNFMIMNFASDDLFTNMMDVSVNGFVNNSCCEKRLA